MAPTPPPRQPAPCCDSGQIPLGWSAHLSTWAFPTWPSGAPGVRWRSLGVSSCPSLPALLFFKCVLRTLNLAHQGWVPREMNLAPARRMQAQGWGDSPAGRHLRCGEGGARVFPELYCKEGSDLLLLGQVRACHPCLAPWDPFPSSDHSWTSDSHPRGHSGACGPTPYPQSWGPGLSRPSLSGLVASPALLLLAGEVELGGAQSATLLTTGSGTSGWQTRLLLPLLPRKGGGETRE